MTMREVTELEAKFLDKMRNLNPRTQEFLLAYMDDLETEKQDLHLAKSTGTPIEQFMQATAHLSMDAQSIDEIKQAIESMRTAGLIELPEGEPGWKFVEALQDLDFSPEDLAEMNNAMEDLEKMNLDEW